MARQLPQPDGARRLDFIPRSQFKAFHKRRQRWACLICHRRCGKTHATIADLVIKALHTPGGRYAYIAPLYNQAKVVAWDVLKDYSRPFWASPPNESELRVDLIGGARISLFGGDNPDRLRGPGFDGVVLDEYADIAPSLFSRVLRPALADRGGFAVIIGTVRGRNHLWQQYENGRASPDWYTVLLKASQTGQLSPEELASSRDTMSEEQYASEFECDPYAAIVGAFYGQDITVCEEEGRITVLPPEPGVPVHTAWDLGHRHSTAIWFFQVVGPEVRIIDFYENHGQYADHYCGVVAARGYLPGKDFVPHDAKVHEWGTGKTRLETLISFGRNPQLVTSHTIEDGINAAHLMFKNAWFDEVRCAAGLEALRQHRVDFDEKSRAFKTTAKEDWTSDAADAFRYVAMAWKEIAEPAMELPNPLPHKPFQDLSIGEFVDEFEFHYNGIKLIRVDRVPKGKDRC